MEKNMKTTKTLQLAGKTLTVETGHMARQAHGAVTVRYGDTMILATAVANYDVRDDLDFFPLTVEYREKTYAAGKIPGGFFKREGRPSEKEILSARLIDRPIRPLFADHFRSETQIIVSVISADSDNDPDVLGTLGASAALCISDIPFLGPIASVRVGRIEGEYIINPTFSELDESDMELVIAGSKDSIMMVEGELTEVPEEEMIEAIRLGHETIKELVAFQEELQREIGKAKRTVELPELPAGLEQKVAELCRSEIVEANKLTVKEERQAKIDALQTAALDALAEEFPEQEKTIKNIINDIEKAEVRKMIIESNSRIDGRGLADIRPISCEVGLLPRSHGSALFTRGQTQALATTTLGTKVDEQIIDALEGESSKSYMLHYNFPPFCTGEARPIRGTSRREIGHGNLAERALKPVIPVEEDFPYTLRIVSDILESNGSSSMASVCGGSLAMMDAGVPTKCHVAGIAMGLISENEEVRVLSDILGTEDHLGDMDFKVAGTREGITAVQMDIKIKGLNFAVLEQALAQAKEGREHILEKMEETISEARPALSPYAPRITTLQIPVDKIGAVIGPGGKNIRSLIEETGTKIDIDDSGTVLIASTDGEMAEAAMRRIELMVKEPELNEVYEGKVTRLMDFGALVEILPGKEGMVHISELEHRRVENVTDIIKQGEMVKVKVIRLDRDGKIGLSRKALIPRPEGMPEEKPRQNDRRPPRRDGNRSSGPRRNPGKNE
jgi:polyribonucleotide nucleotidyltransferase